MKRKVLEVFMPERKKSYLDEYPSYYNYFGNLGEFEREIINKEAQDFLEEDWEQAFIYLAVNTKLITSKPKLQSTLSAYKGYLKTNHLIEMSERLGNIALKADVLSYASKINIERIRSREEFLNEIICKIEERNVRDAGIYLCLYDGIKGEKNINLRCMLDKEEYFDQNKIVISIEGKEQIFSVSSETIKCLRNANRQTHYYRNHNNPNEPLNRTGYMFRSSGEYITGIMPDSTLNSSIKKLRHLPNQPKSLSSNDIIFSGMINCLIYAEHIHGKQFVNEINFLKRLQKRYRANVEYYTIWATYREYRKQKDIAHLIIDEKYLIEMKVIIDEISAITLTDKELAYVRGPGKKKANGRYIEGGVKFVLHRCKERNPSLIREVKEIWLRNHEHLECEVCSFVPDIKYGEIGKKAIEGHHTKPIKSLTQKTVMHVKDIKLVCSNCHSIIHSNKKKTLSIREIKRLIINKSEANE